MKLSDLDAITTQLDHIRAIWGDRLVNRVVDVVFDARAHAGNALTARLAEATDGRPTAGIAWQNRSARAAVRKIRDLHDWLCGRTSRSLDGKLRDFRETTYRIAFGLHAMHVPESIRVSDEPRPTASNIAIVRGFPLHGLDLRVEIGGSVERAIRQLRATLTRAGSSSFTASQQQDILDNWEVVTMDALTRAVLTSLSDSMVWVISEAHDDLIDPKFREE